MKIELGACFIPADAAVASRAVSGVWEVVDLFAGTDRVPYARLTNSRDRSLSKTVAQAALLDRSLYRLVE